MEQQDMSATVEPQVSAASLDAPPAPAPAETEEALDAKSELPDQNAEAAEGSEEKANRKSSAEKKQKRAPRPETQSMKTVPADQLDKAARTLNTMLDFLGLDATIRAESRPGKVNLLVKSDDAGRIIGHKGQTLSNLQLIVNRIMQKNDADFPKLYIDIENGQQKRDERGETAKPAPAHSASRSERQRRSGAASERGEERAPRAKRRRDERGNGSSRESMLRQQALDAAKEVRLFGQAKTLPPMNSHDRRIIHLTLKDEADLCTESAGEGDCRSVVISLKEGA